MGELGTMGKTGGLTGGTLKYIAIVAMAIDHAALFLPNYYEMPALILHMIGRITAPIIYYFIAEGYHYTRNKNRYTLRLAVFAVISYVPFSLYVGNTLNLNWYNLNMMYTLTIAVLSLRALHEINNIALKVATIAACFVLTMTSDGGSTVVLYVMLFSIFRGNFKYQAWAYTAVAIVPVLTNVSHIVEGLLIGVPFADMQFYVVQAVFSAAVFLPLLLLRQYNGQRGRAGKWFFYIFYPAHLLVLGVVKVLIDMKI